MARPELAGARQRRKLMADDSPQLKELARAYLEAGRLGEALECLERSRDQELLRELAARAKDEGDFWAFRQAHRLLDEPMPAAELEELARRAGSLGKEAYARAAEAAGKGEA